MSRTIFIFTLIAFITLLCVNIYAQNYVPTWVSKAGGTGTDYIRKIAVDSSGNVYSIGRFQNTMTFGTLSISSIGNVDAFIAKSDANGNWIWARGCGSSGDDDGLDIALDSQNNVYITGTYSQNATFGNLNLINNGSEDIFICKLDSSGNWIWANRCGGTNQDVSYGITISQDNFIFITGYFFGLASFGSNSISSSGLADIFVSKLDLQGNWIWARKAGGTSYEYGGSSITTDNSGNAYITGHYYSNPITFGTISLSNYGNADVFVSKISSEGTWVWATHSGGSNWEVGNGIKYKDESLYIVGGYLSQNALFGSTTIPNSGSSDIFIGKMSTSGSWIWTQHCGGSGDDTAGGISIDVENSIFISGQFGNSITVGSSSFTSYGDTDALVINLDNSGNWVYCLQAGGVGFDGGCYGIVTDSYGNVVFADDFSNSASILSNDYVSNGSTDIFIAKFFDATNSHALINSPNTNGLDFNTIYLGDSGTLDILLQSTGTDTVFITQVNTYQTNSVFHIDPTSIPNLVLPNTEHNITIHFIPTQASSYSDTLYIYNSSENHPILKIPLQGIGEYVPPQTPQNVNVVLDGVDGLVTWDAVTQNIYNSPITVPYYFIYGSHVINPTPNEQVFIGYSTGPSFRHLGIGLPGSNVQTPRQYFYTVTAVVWYPTRGDEAYFARFVGKMNRRDMEMLLMKD